MRVPVSLLKSTLYGDTYKGFNKSAELREMLTPHCTPFTTTNNTDIRTHTTPEIQWGNVSIGSMLELGMLALVQC